MREKLERHARKLHIVTAVALAVLAGFAAVVLAISRPHPAFPDQGATLFWILLFATVVNLVTLVPSYRYILATPRRAYEVSQEAGPLLGAHMSAYLLSLARLDVVALLGLGLFFVAGRRDWFWLFEGIAVLGTLILWPRRRKLEELVELPGGS